jgi:thymidylate synthase (FAD)
MADLQFVDQSSVQLVQKLAADDMVCHAAWVSNFTERLVPEHEAPNREKVYDYDARKWVPSEEMVEWNKKTGGLINFLYGNRHMSPFEHGFMTFYIETPIFVAREFMRHRTWSYNEMSGRYTELPPRLFLINSERPIVQSGKIGAYRFETGTPEQYGLIFAETTKAYQQSWDSYQNMLAAGIAKEVARNVLPVGMMTQFYATANIRNIMQFLLLRNDQHALAEIRDVAVSIEKEFAKAMPLTYKAFKKHDWRDEKDELSILRARVKQLEAELTYPELYATVNG